MSQYLHLTEPDPEWLEASKGVAPRPKGVDVLTLRALSDPMSTKLNDERKKDYPETVLKIHERNIPVEGGEIPVRIYVPQPDASKGEAEGHSFPLLVWFHGGGHCLGTLDNDDWRLRDLAVEKRIGVLNVLYRHAPEYKWPTDIDDCYASLKWVIANTSELHADLAKGFLVGGVSAGATLTAVMTHYARDDPEFQPKITGQILEQVFVIHWDAVPEELKPVYLSYEQNKNAPILNHDSMHLFYGADAYAADPADPRTSPLLFPSHASLPPAHFKICGMDPIRDDGFIYADALAKAGVKTKIDIYPGVPHSFQTAYSETKMGKKWIADGWSGVEWLLNGGK